VGVIIGNTGAEVLTTMLSWVQGSMTLEEQDAMIASLKSASKSTAFEQWLGAPPPTPPPSPPTIAASSPAGRTSSV
jgi:zinc finger-like protein